MTPEEIRSATVIAASGVLDVDWYLQRYPDVAQSGVPALWHWVRWGAAEGRRPGPGFDADWYRTTYPDVARAGVDPLLHYLTQGWREHRAPRADFDPLAYEALHPWLRERDVCPLVHEVAASRVVVDDVDEYVAEPAALPPGDLGARTVAFYLPQFHPIPENDRWWGRGFTEWRNVVRGQPRFEGHHQPHRPGELGYYDLRVPEVMARQVELARLHGISAFCFYRYWFGGRTLLDRPLEAFLADTSLDLEFVVCWANEPWTRTWDGGEQDVLVAQEHTPDDDLKFIADAARFLRDPRYLRIDGRPVLVVYRPSLMPSPTATARRWRQWCHENGIGEIVLASVQSFDTADPRDYGFDRALEFPPNAMGPRLAQAAVTDPDFTGTLYDWTDLAGRSESYADPGYPLWRGVCPSWDNEARRPGRGTTLVGSTPAAFSRWTENAILDVCARFPHEDRLVFVNAWNEWAEGAHLEPDERYGYAWLHAVRRAQVRAAAHLRRAGRDAGRSPQGARPVPARAPEPIHQVPPARDVPGTVVVTHDLHPHGAQMLARAMVTRLRELGVPTAAVACGPGDLAADFAALAPLHEVRVDDRAHAARVARDLYTSGMRSAWCNSAASGWFTAVLREAGLHVTSLVHELPGVLALDGVRESAAVLSAAADRVVFPSPLVRDRFPHPVAGDVVVRPQGRYSALTPVAPGRVARLRAEVDAGVETRVVLGVGYGDHRKGLDLFVAAAAHAQRAGHDARYVWVGRLDTSDARIRDALAAAPATFTAPGFRDDVLEWCRAADVLLLPSREDPFPSVTLEALAVGTPVVGLRARTGQDELIARTGGVLLDDENPAALAEAVASLHIGDDAAARTRAELIRAEYDMTQYVHDLLAGTPSALPRVSVVLPNYGYAHLLADRIRQIADQTYPLYELIVLDDASPDDSLAVLETALRGIDLPHRLIVNEHNSGSVFRQWARGVAACRGDLVWIAEADDVADPDLVERLVEEWRENPGTVLASCMSRQIGPDGGLLAPDYADYLRAVPGRDFTRAFAGSGEAELARTFAVLNPVPNVSGTLMDLPALRRVLADHVDEIAALPTAGDWLTYVRLLAHGGFAWCPRVLNGHRRHPDSVVARGLGEGHWREILAVQETVRDLVTVEDDVEEATCDYRRDVARYLGVDEPAALVGGR